ncbi:hypothetical protein [Pseudarthrobacter sulfonivorans]|uniref:hypothetical protein n=1 Tax=Pseudarthrobacter sulfonivorans TaxID=121292 RepID=UPI00285B21B7|nr:hypothetical protein [Pseudarthrobacter sulfonivorans]MDR6415032.1 hypothetical protein [Pseudarthrobacter sulfonivorans]
MDYSNFSVGFLDMLVAVLLGVIAGIITLVLARRKMRRLALAVGLSSALLIGAVLLASGFIQTAKTNAMLHVADELAVPERFEPGKDENFRGGRVVRATAFLPCGAVTAPCPSLHRQWSGPALLELTRADLEEVIRRSGWQGRLVVDDRYCRLTYTNSSSVSCFAEGVLGGFDTTLRLSQTRGDSWWLGLSMRPER